ncbi:hypothetical protein TrCOL_g13046 [Triparma columacea]|uniref:Uncharacterized protein n=1 Tax=Triparma columacea TaxID=722753 RepID=A0A9W7GA90_9STRA|nr:hypothetical protein TrCOL_g13046 [Triparma columacea]
MASSSPSFDRPPPPPVPTQSTSTPLTTLSHVRTSIKSPALQTLSTSSSFSQHNVTIRSLPSDPVSQLLVDNVAVTHINSQTVVSLEDVKVSKSVRAMTSLRGMRKSIRGKTKSLRSMISGVGEEGASESSPSGVSTISETSPMSPPSTGPEQPTKVIKLKFADATYFEFCPIPPSSITTCYNTLKKQIGSYRRMVSASSMDIETRDGTDEEGGTEGRTMNTAMGNITSEERQSAADRQSEASMKLSSRQSAADRQSEASMKLSSLLSQKGTLSPEDALEVKRLMLAKVNHTSSSTSPNPDLDPTSSPILPRTNLISIEDALSQHHGPNNFSHQSSNLEAMLDAKILATSISLPSRATSTTMSTTFTSFSTTSLSITDSTTGRPPSQPMPPLAEAAIQNHMKLDRLLSSKDLTGEQADEAKKRMLFHKQYESSAISSEIMAPEETTAPVSTTVIPIEAAIERAQKLSKSQSSSFHLRNSADEDELLVEQNLEAALDRRVVSTNISSPSPAVTQKKKPL